MGKLFMPVAWGELFIFPYAVVMPMGIEKLSDCQNHMKYFSEHFLRKTAGCRFLLLATGYLRTVMIRNYQKDNNEPGSVDRPLTCENIHHYLFSVEQRESYGSQH